MKALLTAQCPKELVTIPRLASIPATLFGHNRGSHAYFAKLKNVKIGDIVEYKTAIGTKTYQVTFVGSISYTDYSYLNEMGDNRITLITCIANQPSLRLCVQAVEIR